MQIYLHSSQAPSPWPRYGRSDHTLSSNSLGLQHLRYIQNHFKYKEKELWEEWFMIFIIRRHYVSNNRIINFEDSLYLSNLQWDTQDRTSKLGINISLA